MRRVVIWIAIVSATLQNPAIAANMQFSPEALSGQPKAVWVYRSWNSECKETAGVTKVLVKPKHGKLSNKRVVQPVRFNRYDLNDRCIGKVIPGLQVIYTSAPGYRGPDNFVIERTLADGRVDTDTFTMMVR